MPVLQSSRFSDTGDARYIRITTITTKCAWLRYGQDDRRRSRSMSDSNFHSKRGTATTDAYRKQVFWSEARCAGLNDHRGTVQTSISPLRFGMTRTHETTIMGSSFSAFFLAFQHHSFTTSVPSNTLNSPRSNTRSNNTLRTLNTFLCTRDHVGPVFISTLLPNTAEHHEHSLHDNLAPE